MSEIKGEMEEAPREEERKEEQRMPERKEE